MAESSIARAYVQIIPSAQGMKSALSDIFESEGSSAGGIFGSNLVSVIKNTVAAAGLGKMLQEALTEGADKQQSLGGIETLFKESADIVIENASRAYKTAGMSANDYMETVTGFSASLLQGLSGDTQAAAEIADMALTDMADNANKMGTDMEAIQNAYQGFAKQNYTMLDNLKLGYGGTKTEMERLLADAQALTGVKYDISNLADVYSAIHVIQEEMDITGTTAMEASSTFSGSLASMKAAASDLLASLTLGEDITPSLEALSETVFTFVGGNLIPMVGNALSGLPTVISSAMGAAVRGLNLAAENTDTLVSQGVNLVIELGAGILEGLPYLAEAGLNLAISLGESLLNYDWNTTLNDLLTGVQTGLSVIAGEIFGTDGSIVEAVASGVTENLPELLDEGVAIVSEVADGLMSNIPEAVSAAGDLMSEILVFLADCLPEIVDAGVELTVNFAAGILSHLPSVAESAVDVCGQFLGTVASELPDFLEAGFEIIGEIIAGIIACTPDILGTFTQLIVDIGYEFFSYDWGELGRNILSGIASGIVNGVTTVVDAAKQAAESAVTAMKNALAIHSPSRRFRDEVGAQIPPGIALGVEENADVVKASMIELSDYAADSFQADFNVSGSVAQFTQSAQISGGSFAYEDMEMIMQERQDLTAQRLDRIIALLEMILEAILNIDLDGEMITRLGNGYQKLMSIAKGV